MLKTLIELPLSPPFALKLRNEKITNHNLIKAPFLSFFYILTVTLNKPRKHFYIDE